MNLNDKVMLGFEQNHSFSLVMLRKYPFMHTAHTSLKALIYGGWDGLFVPLVREILHFVRKMLWNSQDISETSGRGNHEM